MHMSIFTFINVNKIERIWTLYDIICCIENRKRNGGLCMENMKSYTLYNKNHKVLDFLYDEDNYTIQKISKIYDHGMNYAPLGIIDYKQGITKKKLNTWWKGRAIPASRNGIEALLDELRLNDIDELTLKSFGASLSDQYWIKPHDLDLTWDDINFFHNQFSEDLGELLFDKTSNNDSLNLASPDATSDGNLKKRWKIINDTRYLIKGGSSYLNQEPFNEVIATHLYRRLLNEDDYVPYEIIKIDNAFFSMCPNFINDDEELVPAIHIDSIMKFKANDNLYSRFLKCCDILKIPDARNKIDKMIVCDYILANKDRHYRNFGAVRNVETLTWKGISPIYDSGTSLWCNEDIGTPYKAKPFNSNDKKQLYLVKDLSWFNIDKLDGFDKDIRHILSMNPRLEKERIQKIIDVVNTRIKNVQIYAEELNSEMNVQLSKKKTGRIR